MQNLGTIDNTYTILSLIDVFKIYGIYSVRHNQTQALHLIEVFKDNIPANLMNIMNTLIGINHPNITHIIGHGNGPIALNNEPQVNMPYIVYENVSHSNLYEYISIQHFTERQAKWIFKKILEGVQALHNANICHRDLEVHNILFDDNYNPKIIGFHSSCINMNNLNRRTGRLPYIAPEILLNQPYNGITADIFSLGQILFNLVTGKKGGFNAANDNDPYYTFIIKHQIAHYWKLLDSHHLNVSQDFKNLFIGMVDPNPAQRPTIADILKDPWMQEINDLNQNEINVLENQVINEFQIREQQIQQDQQNQQIQQNQQNQQNQLNQQNNNL